MTESEGYPRLGQLMGSYPGYAIFRRFGALNTENLLYLQAEIHCLEGKLRKQQKEDRESGHEDRRLYHREWETLEESNQATAEPGNDGTQMDLMLQIRQKLKEYNEALLLQREVIKLSQPNKKRLQFLQSWMQRPTMGNVYLLGKDSDIWSEPDLLDLVALKAPSAEDLLTEWIFNRAVKWFHQSLGRFWRKPGTEDYLGNTVSYGNSSLIRLAKLVATMLACLLPILSIIVLYVVESMSRRLGIIGAFTAVFSLCMGLVTSASMAEIFAATAAFAAVQVVFVGSTTSGSP